MSRSRRATLVLVALGTLSAGARARPAAQPPPANRADLERVPRTSWARATPESVGYSTPRLEALRAWLKTLDTKAMFVAVHGQEIFEYGDLAHASKIASVRKRMGALLDITDYAVCARPSRSTQRRRAAGSLGLRRHVGANGQFMTVLPAEDMVIAHTVDFEANGKADASSVAYDAILAMAINARCQSRDRC